MVFLSAKNENEKLSIYRSPNDGRSSSPASVFILIHSGCICMYITYLH